MIKKESFLKIWRHIDLKEGALWFLGSVSTSAAPLIFVIIYSFMSEEPPSDLIPYVLDIMILIVNISSSALVVVLSKRNMLYASAFWSFCILAGLATLFSWGLYCIARGQLEKWQNISTLKTTIIVLIISIVTGFLASIITKSIKEE